MDNLDDSENNAKISDSAYSNSCSNSQSRRSHSSKSTHSGSNSSGSSGYGGKPSTSGSSNILQPPKKEKEPKKKKLLPQIEAIEIDEVVEEVGAPEQVPTFETPEEEQKDVIPALPPAQTENGAENMKLCVPELATLKDEVVSGPISQVNPVSSFVTGRPLQVSYCAIQQSKRFAEIGRYELRCENSEQLRCKDGFSCVISMHDGVVMYATSTLTTTLGFPKDMWIGRSFIDFVHPRDRNTFASQITNGLAVPKTGNNGTLEKVQTPANSVSTMVCRIRRYRGLTTSFSVKERGLGFLPFLLKLTFKNISDEEGKVTYLVIQATPFFSAFKTPNEMVIKAASFVIRHAANGRIEYVDQESVPYLGYMPQDLVTTDALLLYHPEDLMYLRQVYETIVKEGGLPRSKSYRMMAQNGDYIRLETEWSSFINPWSKKLEFVIGKHFIIEGPTNPDVFLPPESEKSTKVSEEEKNKAQMLRENIIRTMNEALTKPAEMAKQQMSKRCQDLASFMESLMEEAPKTEEELRLEIQDPDHSYYERDSVMLGGISPHHDYYDSQSSTGTPLSYNQINYNETLQRYFDSQQPHSYEDYKTVNGENILGLEARPSNKYASCLSPMAQRSGDSGEMTSSSDSNGMIMISNSPLPPGDYQPIRLTESLLNKHNEAMEKELLKTHRETRSSSKGDREKNSATRKKKKEHLARCNASYHPTSAGATEVQQPHGLKRASKMMEADAGPHKHHCTSNARQARRNKRTLSTSAAVTQPSPAITTTVASNQWPSPPVNNMNTYVMGVGIPQQMSLMPHPMQPMHMPAVPGMFPMYYAPAAQPMPSTSAHHYIPPTGQQHQFQAPMMMYGHPMYGQPIIYSPMTQQVSYPTQPSMMAPAMQQYNTTMYPLGLTSSNYEEACKPSLTLRPNSAWRDKKRPESQGTSSKTDIGSANSLSSNALNRESVPHKSHKGNEDSTIYSTDIRSSNSLSQKSTEAATNTPPMKGFKKLNHLGNSEETPDKTDGESSYSSFYSSFFKTESGSAEDSGDGKKGNKPSVRSPLNATTSYHVPQPVKMAAQRKTEPPWLEQVCVTSELVYKYQIQTKSVEETLTADQLKMQSLEQPSLVNEQLSQLYLDLQLEGVAARLTLEEGITSSSSSGEENTISVKKTARRKREYSKLVMIYEEDAPLPPPSDDAAEASSSTC